MNDADGASADIAVGDVCIYPPRVCPIQGRLEARIFMILDISPTLSWVKVMVLLGDVTGVFPRNFTAGACVTIYGALHILKKSSSLLTQTR
jgi:hypothetical protein